MPVTKEVRLEGSKELGSLDTFASYGDWLRKKEQDPIGFRP